MERSVSLALVLLALLACKGGSDTSQETTAAPAPAPAPAPPAPSPAATPSADSATATTTPTARATTTVPLKDAAVAPVAEPAGMRKAGEVCTRAAHCASGVCCVTASSKGYVCVNAAAECKSNVLKLVGASCASMQECDSLVCCATTSSGNAKVCVKHNTDCKGSTVPGK